MLDASIIFKKPCVEAKINPMVNQKSDFGAA